MDKQFLKEKLAKWAGIDIEAKAKEKYISSVREYAGKGYIGNETWERDCEEWRKQSHRRSVTPNFTQSLDACFKWLYPKFNELVYDPCEILEPWVKRIVHLKEEPALALCLAIEKLIDLKT